MKDATARKNFLPSTPRQRGVESISTLPAPYGGVGDEDDAAYLRWLLVQLNMTRKQLANLMGVNDTTADRWCSGERASFLKRTQDFLEKVQKINPTLMSFVLLRLAGPTYDGLILDPAKKENLEALAEAVKK